jgi:hypothetical protein
MMPMVELDVFAVVKYPIQEVNLMYFVNPQVVAATFWKMQELDVFCIL